MIYKNNETRAKILQGAEILYDAVRTTMGPKGHNVLVKDKFGNFSITHDGVTVAKAVKHDDPSIQMGIDLMKEASKEMDKIGDGTTSVTVLTYHLIIELSKLVEAGVNPMNIKRELDGLVDTLIAEVDKRSIAIPHTLEGVYNVAKISAEDDELATMIAELVVGTGFEGAINVETVSGNDTTSELVDGYLFPSGYASPHFITNKSSREAVLHNPAVLVIEGTMDSMQTYGELIGQLLEQKVKDILVITDTVDPEVLSALLINKARGTFNATVVKNYLGAGYAADVAAVTGAGVYSNATNEPPTLALVGKAGKVVISDSETIIFDGSGEIKDHLNAIRSQNKKNPTAELDERIASLAGKVGSIKVGGVNDTEAKEKKYRIDDAVAATRAALKGGIVAGGGTTLAALPRSFPVAQLHPTNEVLAAVAVALQKPREVLLDNSGIGYDVNVQSLDYPLGINVMNGEVADMVETGIVDPTIVTKEVIRNAFTTAGIAITVGGAVVEEPVTAEELKMLMEAGN